MFGWSKIGVVENAKWWAEKAQREFAAANISGDVVADAHGCLWAYGCASVRGFVRGLAWAIMTQRPAPSAGNGMGQVAFLNCPPGREAQTCADLQALLVNGSTSTIKFFPRASGQITCHDWISAAELCWAKGYCTALCQQQRAKRPTRIQELCSLN